MIHEPDYQAPYITLQTPKYEYNGSLVGAHEFPMKIMQDYVYIIQPTLLTYCTI